MKKIYILLALVFLVFWIKSFFYLDPDFGYRLKTGLIILSDTFPRADPYTYTMPYFPYVEHAWLTAIFWAYLFPKVGQIGLSAVYAFLAVVALLISIRPKISSKNIKFISLPLILAVTQIMPYTGIRAQIVSWVFVALLFKLISSPKFWGKYKYFLPLFFLFWANTHGSWVAGLVMIGIVFADKILKTKRINPIDILVFVSSVLITLVNPYGVGLWREVWLSLSDPQIKSLIAEWKPIFTSVNIGFIFFFPLSVLFVYKYRKKFNFSELAIFLFLLIESLMSKRHLPIWTFVALPMTIESINHFYKEVTNIKFGKERFTKLYNIGVTTFVCVFILTSFLVISDAAQFSEKSYYPVGAVKFLKENPYEGNLFSTYGWGGYLILTYPEKKVFIDGRMPSWRLKDAPPGQTTSAFDDYTNMLKGEKDFAEVFDKYDIQTLLLPHPSSKDESVLSRMDNYMADLLVYFGREKNDFDFNEAIKESGWHEIYQDETAIVYKK